MKFLDSNNLLLLLAGTKQAFVHEIRRRKNERQQTNYERTTSCNEQAEEKKIKSTDTGYRQKHRLRATQQPLWQ